MTIAAIFPDDVRPSIDDSSWASLTVSGVVSGNAMGNGRWWVTKHLFNHILRCHVQDNIIDCKVNQGVACSELPGHCQIWLGNVAELQTLRARESTSLGEHGYPQNSVFEGLYV